MVQNSFADPPTGTTTLDSEWEDAFSTITTAVHSGLDLHPGDVQRRDMVIILLRATKAYNAVNVWKGVDVVEPRWTDGALERMAVLPSMAVQRIKEPYVGALDCFVVCKSLEQYEIKHLQRLVKNRSDSTSSTRHGYAGNRTHHTAPSRGSVIFGGMYRSLLETGIAEPCDDVPPRGSCTPSSLALPSTLEEAILLPDLGPFGSSLRTYVQDFLAATEIYVYHADLFTAGYRAAAQDRRLRGIPIMENFESDEQLSLLYQSLLRVVLRATLNYRKRLEKFRPHLSSSPS